MVRKQDSERHLLLFSVWMGVLFTVLGIGWGLAIRSGAILFDGIYSGFSIILSLLSIAGLEIVSKPDDHNFQFGRMSFEPLILALKAVVIVGVCLYGIVTAVLDIMHGGAHVQSLLAGTLYGMVSIALCLMSWFYIESKGTNLPDFVQAESEQWLIDTVFSGFVMLSFVISYVIEGTALKRVVPYIDPVVVVCGSLYFIRIPLARLVNCLRELLLMAPPREVMDDMRQRIIEIGDAHGFPRVSIRCAKIGRELVVDITFLAGKDMKKFDLSELDAVRQEVQSRLAELGFTLWLNVLFTKDEQWA